LSYSIFKTTHHHLKFSNKNVFYLNIISCYCFPLTGGSQPVPLTPDYGVPDVSYADGVFDPHFSRYVTVMEGA
jgi:hypothetical protein